MNSETVSADQLVMAHAIATWKSPDIDVYREQLGQRVEETRDFHTRLRSLHRDKALGMQFGDVTETDYLTDLGMYHQDRSEVLFGYAESMALAKPVLHGLRAALLQKRAHHHAQRGAKVAEKLSTVDAFKSVE